MLLLSKTRTERPAFIIRPATPDEEMAYLRYLVGKSEFYRTHGYTVALPDHPAFAEMRTPRAGGRTLPWPEICAIFERSIYREDEYSLGVARLESERGLIAQALPYLRMLQAAWPFAIPLRYTIALTLYGVGGSYDEQNGKIVVRTTPSGSFRRARPFHTVLHEMVHIGIEQSLVRSLCLAHSEKERVVDLGVFPIVLTVPRAPGSA